MRVHLYQQRSLTLFMGTISVWASHPSLGPCLWQLTLLIPVQAGQKPQSLETAGYKYIVGSLAKNLGVVCSCPGPGPEENKNLHGGGLVIIFRLFLPWLTYSCCAYSVFHVVYPPFTAQPVSVTQLCGSSLASFQCLSIPLNVGCFKLSAVFLKAKLRAGIYRIKKALLHLRHTVFVLFVYTQCIIRFFKKILFVTVLHHIF